MAVNKALDVDSLEWLQWENKRGLVTAHAVDPDSLERTGKLRTVSGAIVPAGIAVKADPGTPRDHFSESIVQRITADQERKNARVEAKAQAKAAREASDVERAAQRKAKAEALAMDRLRKAEAKAHAKAEKAAAKKPAPAKIDRVKKVEAEAKAQAKAEKAKAVEERAGARPPTTSLKLTKNKKEYEVRHFHDGVQEVVGTFPAGLFDPKGPTPRIAVTDKAWVVVQGKKAVASGSREAA